MNELAEPIRILHVVGALQRGGAETLIMNIYRHIDRTRVQFDFVIHNEENDDYRAEIEALGGRIYKIPQFHGANYKAYCSEWNDLFCQHPEWKILHGHVRSTAGIYMYLAKKADRMVIAHSHSISNGRGVAGHVKDMLQFPVRYIADYFFACSEDAGVWMFGRKTVKNRQKYKTIKNGIDIGRFRFDKGVRASFRGVQGISDKKVIGTVGRITDAKNPLFIVEVVEKLLEIRKDVIFVWGGDGEKRAEVEAEIQNRGLSDFFCMLGSVDNADILYNAMDVFLFPSKWEGLGISLIEAQTSGLPCFISENVPSAAVITDAVIRITLDKGCAFWAEEIDKTLQCSRDRSGDCRRVAEAGYDIREVSAYLSAFYLKHSL